MFENTKVYESMIFVFSLVTLQVTLQSHYTLQVTLQRAPRWLLKQAWPSPLTALSSRGPPLPLPLQQVPPPPPYLCPPPPRT